MAQEVILRLDSTQEFRELSDAKFTLRAKLKKKLLGWAVIKRARKKQCSRITNLKEGDANTKFFHLKANACRQKSFIQHLQKANGWVENHEDKEEVVTEHFAETMSCPDARTGDINWSGLPFLAVDLSALDLPITEEEIQQAISQLPQDKAPGPDGSQASSSKNAGS